MIRTGEVLVNAVTGERMRFLATAADTDGAYVELELTLAPDGFVAAAHLHPAQTETFQVVSGTLGFRVGRETLTAGPGETLEVPAGTAHRFWNAGQTEAVFRCRVAPALQFESLIETMFGLAEDGKTNKKGLPNPLRLAVIARAHRDVVLLPFPPRWLQLAGLACGAPLGRLVGYRPTYVPASRRTAEDLAPSLVGGD